MASTDYFARRSPAVRLRSAGTPSSPHTPLLNRSLSSQFGSPASFRTEDETVVYEIGSRHLRAGFAGESAPRCRIGFGPEDSRRVGDFRRWEPGYQRDALRKAGPWAGDWELWGLDVRNVELGLVEDKLERAIREAHTEYLSLDLKGRKAVLAIPPCLPHPLLEVVLTVLFNQPLAPPSIAVLSTPLLNTVAAGLRSSLTVDIGWHETTVTAIFEYRQVAQKRTDRAGKMLSLDIASLLDSTAKASNQSEALGGSKATFATAEETMMDMAWCKSRDGQSGQGSGDSNVMSTSGGEVSFDDLAEPAERTFFDQAGPLSHDDDEHQPLHIMIWKCLLALPVDVRAVCVSRIVISGGGSCLPGLKARLLEEVTHLVSTKGWDPVMNYGSAVPKREAKIDKSTKVRPRSQGPEQLHTTTEEGTEVVLRHDTNLPLGSTSRDVELRAGARPQEKDTIQEKLAQDALRAVGPSVKSVVRGVETLGAWAGASLMAHLRVDGSAEIKRDDFLKHGLEAYKDLM